MTAASAPNNSVGNYQTINDTEAQTSSSRSSAWNGREVKSISDAQALGGMISVCSVLAIIGIVLLAVCHQQGEECSSTLDKAGIGTLSAGMGGACFYAGIWLISSCRESRNRYL